MRFLENYFFESLALLIAILLTASAKADGGPGLTFHPTPPKIRGTDNILIWYKSSNLTNVQEWVERLGEFLSVYNVAGSISGSGGQMFVCDYSHPPQKDQACYVDIKNFGACTEENNFGYNSQSPCVFLKLENTVGWIPEYYNSTKDLPVDMPMHLKDQIAQIEKNRREMLNTVWVSCEGLSPADNENIGPLQYSPQNGFPGYFFQGERPENYLSPLLALKFEQPMRGIIISVECKLWARNIAHNSKINLGNVQFELLLD